MIFDFEKLLIIDLEKEEEKSLIVDLEEEKFLIVDLEKN